MKRKRRANKLSKFLSLEMLNILPVDASKSQVRGVRKMALYTFRE